MKILGFFLIFLFFVRGTQKSQICNLATYKSEYSLITSYNQLMHKLPTITLLLALFFVNQIHSMTAGQLADSYATQKALAYQASGSPLSININLWNGIMADFIHQNSQLVNLYTWLPGDKILCPNCRTTHKFATQVSSSASKWEKKSLMTFHIYVNRKLFMFYIMSKYNYERAGAFGSLCISNDPFAPPPEPYFSPNCMYTEAFSGSYGSRTTQMSVLGFNIMGILNLDQNPDTIDWSIVINSNI